MSGRRARSMIAEARRQSFYRCVGCGVQARGDRLAWPRQAFTVTVQRLPLGPIPASGVALETVTLGPFPPDSPVHTYHTRTNAP